MTMNTIGFIGLGRMGRNMALHLLEQGMNVVAYNRTSAVTDAFADEVESILSSLLPHEAESFGALTTVDRLQDMIQELSQPRCILLMVKAGSPVDDVISELSSVGLARDDILIDAGNSFYEDTKRRYAMLQEQGIHYIDCGTSGGLEGARSGACLMIGGEESIVESLDDLWNALAGKNTTTKQSLGGWAYVGPSGAGHFVKMVHNAIEYGMNQAIGEGFAMLEKSSYGFDLVNIADLFRHGSVIRGWLIELLHRALLKDPRLEYYQGIVGGGETGQWALETAKSLNVPYAVLEQAIIARERSQTKPDFSTKVVSALRYEYGGHTEKGDEQK